MMATLKYLLVIYFFFSIGREDASGQVDFFPPGAEWYYSFKNPGLLQVRGYTKIYLIGDEEIGGRQAKRLGRTNYYLDYDNPTVPIDTSYEEPFYMAQSGDSVFYYVDTSFQLLWRNDVQANDQFEFNNPYGENYQMKVDSTEDVLLGTEEAMKMWISGGTMYCCWGHTVIYDRFGPVNGMLYYRCWGWYDCYDSSLCRYKSDATGVVDFNGSHCDNLLSGTAEPTTEKIKIYPNPARDDLYISMSDIWNESKSISLFSQTGQILYTDEIHGSQICKVDIISLAPGLYYCRIGDEVFKVIKL